MTVVDRKAAILPPQRRQTIDVPAIGGEVVVQAMTLSESLRISMIDGDPKLRIPHILAAGVLASDMKPLWSADEWDVFGSVDDNRLACMELCNAILGLSHEEKKTLPPN